MINCYVLTYFIERECYPGEIEWQHFKNKKLLGGTHDFE